MNIFIIAFEKALKLSGLKKAKIAEITGIQAGRITQYAKGDTEPGLDKLCKIAQAFDMTVSQFLALGEEYDSEPHEPPTLYGTDLSDIKDILKAIATATLGQIEMTKQADLDIIKAIKQNKIEEYEKLLERRDAYIVKLQEDIEELKAEVHRLQTKVANKLLVLVPDKNGDSCAA